MIKKRYIYSLSFTSHAVFTVILNLISMGWQMVILDIGGRTVAPVSLIIIHYVGLMFSLPLLLPIALILPYLGHPDPANDPIYLIILILNSATVAWLITWFIARKTRNKTI